MENTIAAKRIDTVAFIDRKLTVLASDKQSIEWKMIEDLEPELFAQAIRLAGGNQAKAAPWLGITRLKLTPLACIRVRRAADADCKILAR